VYSGGGSSGVFRDVDCDGRFGVGEGVISVDGVTSTSSASRYHFLRRV
jgi:hypothetical protein